MNIRKGLILIAKKFESNIYFKSRSSDSFARKKKLFFINKMKKKFDKLKSMQKSQIKMLQKAPIS